MCCIHLHPALRSITKRRSTAAILCMHLRGGASGNCSLQCGLPHLRQWGCPYVGSMSCSSKNCSRSKVSIGTSTHTSAQICMWSLEILCPRPLSLWSQTQALQYPRVHVTKPAVLVWCKLCKYIEAATHFVLGFFGLGSGLVIDFKTRSPALDLNVEAHWRSRSPFSLFLLLCSRLPIIAMGIIQERL